MNDRYNKAFTLAYVMLFFTLTLAATVYVHEALRGSRVVHDTPKGIVVKPIGNKTFPNRIAEHFNGNPYSTFDGAPMGVRDGYCNSYTNAVSWIVIECYGSIAQEGG